MRPRARLAAGGWLLAIAMACAPPAASQQVAAAPLSQVDPWGVGWLATNEPGVPASFWSGTTSEALAPVFAAIAPGELSPAGRTMLRRTLLSKAKAPQGGSALIPERLRLLEELGYPAYSVDLRKRYPDTEWGRQADRLATELDLVQGKKEGCTRLQGRPVTDRQLMPLRALCAALNGDFKAASLAGEQVADVNAELGVWLLAALENLSEPTRTPPEGRYGSMFEAAVSLAARLSAPAGAMSQASPDIAASIALNPSATLEQRRAALRPGLESGRLRSQDVLAVLTAKDDRPGPPKAPGRAAAPRPNLLADALAAFASPEARPEARAAAYAAALRSAETPSEARLTALALFDAIRALPRSQDTLAYAEVFARASLMTGDTRQASDWRKLMASAAPDRLDAWALARVDLALSYAGAPADKPGAILERLLAAAPLSPPPQAGRQPAAGKQPSSADRQLDLRRIENTRILFLYAGAGRDLTPAQRALLASQKSAGRGVSDAAITRISAAIDQGAQGEAAMAILGLLGADTSALSFAGLSDLIGQLRRIAFDREADAIALEALQVWKAL